MEDAGERDRVIATLYMDLADAIKENNYNAVIILKAKIEKEERHKINEESHPLYSIKRGNVISYSEKVVELNEMYDDLLFELSDNSNESIITLKTFSAEEILKFNKRVVEKLKRNAKHTDNTD